MIASTNSAQWAKVLFLKIGVKSVEELLSTNDKCKMNTKAGFRKFKEQQSKKKVDHPLAKYPFFNLNFLYPISYQNRLPGVCV